MSVSPEVLDELRQKAEWRARIEVALRTDTFDRDTLSEMVNAGLSQSHSEGLQDAAYICERIAGQLDDQRGRHVCNVLAAAIKELDRRNRAPVVATERERNS